MFVMRGGRVLLPLREFGESSHETEDADRQNEAAIVPRSGA